MNSIPITNVNVTTSDEFFPGQVVDKDKIYVLDGRDYIKQIILKDDYESFPSIFFVIDAPLILPPRRKLIAKEYRKSHDLVSQKNNDFDDLRITGDTIDGRKDLFLNIQGIDFHYCDEHRLIANYNNTFRQLLLVELLTEITTSNSSHLNAKIPEITGANFDKETVIKWISRNQIPDISPNEMLRRYQIEIINQDKVDIGLEVLDRALMDLTELEEFEREIEHLKNDYSLTLQQDEIEKNKEPLRKRAAQRVIQRLAHVPRNAQNASNEVLIFARFEIHEEQDYYMLIYPHPVKKYYGEDIRISVRVRKNDITSDYKPYYEDLIGGKIPLKVYGNIFNPIDPESGLWNFIVRPFAIYQ